MNYRERVNVSRGQLWLSVAAGGVLAAYAVKRLQAKERYPRPVGEKGTGIIADRGSDTRAQLGGGRGIHVEEWVTVQRPLSDLYRFWRNFENLPTFMQHLQSVSMREEGVSHWVANGPAGMRVEWDARIINEVPDKVIGWQSLEGSTISTAGSVNFDRDPEGTRVTVHLQYQPPGGRLGAVVARLFGEEPNQTIREDLRRFKQLMETGRIPTTSRQPSVVTRSH